MQGKLWKKTSVILTLTVWKVWRMLMTIINRTEIQISSRVRSHYTKVKMTLLRIEKRLSHQIGFDEYFVGCYQEFVGNYLLYLTKVAYL